jgi:hypothetical protein
LVVAPDVEEGNDQSRGSKEGYSLLCRDCWVVDENEVEDEKLKELCKGGVVWKWSTSTEVRMAEECGGKSGRLVWKDEGGNVEGTVEEMEVEGERWDRM